MDANNTIEVISTTDGFYHVRHEWNTLLAESVNQEIGLTWEWMNTWWNIFHDKNELFIIVVKKASEIIGIAPFYRRKIYRGPIYFRQIALICSGEDETDEICTESAFLVLEQTLMAQ